MNSSKCIPINMSGLSWFFGGLVYTSDCFPTTAKLLSLLRKVNLIIGSVFIPTSPHSWRSWGLTTSSQVWSNSHLIYDCYRAGGSSKYTSTDQQLLLLVGIKCPSIGSSVVRLLTSWSLLSLHWKLPNSSVLFQTEATFLVAWAPSSFDISKIFFNDIYDTS